MIYIDKLHKMEHKAEECECAHMFLDDLDVPKKSIDGEKYSLVGRIQLIVMKSLLMVNNLPTDSKNM